MGDRTNCSLTVYSCPIEQVRAVLGVVEEHLGSSNDFGEGSDIPDTLLLGGTIGAWEASCGSSDEIASALMNHAPGAAFMVWEDPRYEWLGSMNAYVPELGHFGAECDANGQPQFTPTQVRKIVEMETREEREAAIGDPWLASGVFHGLLPRKERRVLPALPECPEGDWWGEDPSCTVCVEVVDKQRAKDEHRVVVEDIQGTDLVRVVARPTAITFQCKTCTCHHDALNGRSVLVTTTGYWPTEAEVHSAHKGFGIGVGNHRVEDMEIKEVTV